MTDLRKAAEMALPLLIAYQDYTNDPRIANKCGEVIAAIKAELAKPEQADLRKAAEMALGALIDMSSDENSIVKRTTARKALRQALAKPEQEPVAWGFKSKSGAIIDCISHEQHEILAGEYDHPLYTSPPRKESENPDGAFIDEGSKPEQEFKYTPYGLRSDENGKLSIGEISQREWIGLTFKDLPDEKFGNLDFRRGALWAEDKLKEKNHAV